MYSGIRFLQSAKDFPLQVTLGDKVPAWGLSRWAGHGLRFLPPDDEGFTLRGDRQRLVYKGRRCSHRFTILGDTAFEYDCILNREPERNVISLLMEGAECFDFFRQPDFVKDPFLAGSYAVYKKETLIGEGTGKLCHIHRPEVIDSRGRRCWGDLSIIGNELRITVPETWLSEAKYPVVVDPTIGTSTVGSQYLWDNDDPGEEPVPLFFEYMLGVNRFLVSETIDGTCTAFIYTNDDDVEAGGRPVVYSDNGDKPQARRSSNESLVDFRVTSGKPKGWRNGTFQADGSIASGGYIWFGVCAEYWWYPRFDYGAKCYRDWWDMYDSVPDIYPLLSANDYYNFKLSMYFTYSAAQNYTRTLTQGVTLLDTRNQVAAYRRAMSMNTNGVTLLGHSSTYVREQINTATVTDVLNRFRGFLRFLAEQVHTGDLISYCRDFVRRVANRVGPVGAGKRGLGAWRGLGSLAGTGDVTVRGRGFTRFLVTVAAGADITGRSIGRLRVIVQGVAAFDGVGHVGDYLRGLVVEAGSIAETKHRADYYRRREDTAHSGAVSLRHLFIFLRLVTLSFVRDYLLSRFLRSREELVIKSTVVRELVLESKIQ